MGLSLGVDIGGTFTDFALHDAARGEVFLHKRLTTPEAPGRAVLEGAVALLAGTDPVLAEKLANFRRQQSERVLAMTLADKA